MHTARCRASGLEKSDCDAGGIKKIGLRDMRAPDAGSPDNRTQSPCAHYKTEQSWSVQSERYEGEEELEAAAAGPGLIPKPQLSVGILKPGMWTEREDRQVSSPAMV